MRNSLQSVKKKLISRDALENENLYHNKKTDINVLLNRVKIDKKKREYKKIIIYCCRFIRYFFIRCINILKLNFFNNNLF